MTKDPEAYEQDWYNSLKAFAAKRAEAEAASDAEPTDVAPQDDTAVDEDPVAEAIDDAGEEATEPEPDDDEIAYETSDPSTLASLEAIEAIAEIDGPGAVDALVASLVDPEPVVRLKCLRHLAKIGDARAVTAVTELLDDPDPRVAERARTVLDRLSANA